MRVEPLAARASDLVNRAHHVPEAVRARAAAIVSDVRENGDAALRRLTAELDGCDLADPWLDDDAWNAACNRVDPDLRAAIERNLERIRTFHAGANAVEMETAPGVRLGRLPIPLQRVACYVPGGRAAYPSTVLMTVAPAALAGVPDIVVVTPPGDDGSVADAVCFAARAAGAHRILRAGGAQAVAAVAYGTSAVPAADALVGPGNAYVTAAKQIVGDRLRLDFPAGPSELLVVADATCDATHVALDLVAQAEHDPDAQVVLVATDAGTAEDIVAAVQKIVPTMPRQAIVQASLASSAFLVAPLDEALAFANDYAPEHLSLAIENPRAALANVRTAGSVFLGDTPVSLGDYGSGTNHVLPTMGYARLHGGLSIEHFRRWMTWQETTPAGVDVIGPDIVALARAEGLHGHAEAVTGRRA